MSDTEQEDSGRGARLTQSKVKVMLAKDRKSLVEEITVSVISSVTDSFKSAFLPELTASLTEKLLTYFDDIFEQKLGIFTGELAVVHQSVDDHDSIISNFSKRLEAVEEVNRALVSEIQNLKLANDDLKDQITKIAIPDDERINSIQERIEERTNRSLRQTMVFRGIPGKPKESWASTTRNLATSIGEALDISDSKARGMINRAHRGGKKKNVIFANFFRWEDTEEIIKAFREWNIEEPERKIFVDYKYGPLTTIRRSDALALRKELKSSKTIVSGYVRYPAGLMVKYTNDDEIYTLHKDFSKEKVVFKQPGQPEST